jgi:hypothetical protein
VRAVGVGESGVRDDFSQIRGSSFQGTEIVSDLLLAERQNRL